MELFVSVLATKRLQLLLSPDHAASAGVLHVC
jgi:hypothetical protein